MLPVNWRAIAQTVDLDELIKLHQPSYILFAVSLPCDADAAEIKKFLHCFEMLERTARKTAIPVLFLSSARVFDGRKRICNELDVPNATDAVAQAYMSCENLLSKKSRRHIILRSSWLYAASGDNFMRAVLDGCVTNDLLSFNSAGKGCPTALDDLARVLIAMLLQLGLTSQAWGLYHYVSSDPALGFQFVEAIVAQASQFNAAVNSKQLRFEHSAEPRSDFYFEPVVLSCEKILANFGIHQKPWRALIGASVKQYFELQGEDVDA